MAGDARAGPGEPSIPSPTDAAIEAALLGSPPSLTAGQLAERLGLAVDEVLRLWRLMGFPAPEEHEVVFVEGDLVLFEAAAAGRALLGVEGFEPFLRVLASSQARVADAAMSAARSNLTGPMFAGGAPAEEVVEAGRVATEALSRLLEARPPTCASRRPAATTCATWVRWSSSR